MSGMMMHGLGDCTPELNCGCMAKPPDVLRERIADTVRAHRPGASIDAYRCECGARWTSAHVADAVIAALGLGPAVERYGAQESDGTVYGWEPDVETVRREWRGMPVMRCYFYVTPWERIEEGK